MRTRREAAPAATVLAQCAWWAHHQGQEVREATMWRALRRLGWTPKKSSQQANVMKRPVPHGGQWWPRIIRGDWSLWMNTVPIPRSRVSPGRPRTTSGRPRNPGKNQTALTWQGIPAPWAGQGAMASTAFQTDVPQILVPTRHPAQISIMDHLSGPNTACMAEALAAQGGPCWFFLPRHPTATPLTRRSPSYFANAVAGLAMPS